MADHKEAESKEQKHGHSADSKQHKHWQPLLPLNASGSVAIVGCGVAGVITALLMSDHCPHVRITVIDSQSGAGQVTSFAPAAETLFVPPPAVFQDLSSLYNFTALFRWRVFRWLLKRAVRGGFNRQDYGLKCRQEFKACLARHPELAPFCKREGVLHMAIQPALNEQYKAWVESLKGKHDEKHYQYLSADAARQMEPAIEKEVFYGAVLSTRDGYIQQEKFIAAAMDVCRARGVQFLFCRRVCSALRLGKDGQVQLSLRATDGAGGGYADSATGVQTYAKDVRNAKPELQLFDKVVICSGNTTIQMANIIGGESLTGEMIPIKGYSVTGRKKTLSAVPQRALVYRELDKFCRSLYDDPTTHEDDHMYRVGGGVVLEGWPTPNVDLNEMRGLFQDTEMGRSLFNNGENRHIWTGLRPTTPNNRPLVRAMANNRVFINSGHGSNGFVYPWYSTIELLQLMWPTHEPTTSASP